MKKLLNSPDTYVDDMLSGLCAAYPSLVREQTRVVRSTDAPRKGKVGIVSGGGSGHLPLFTGYVGRGMIDSCAIGDVFAGPTVGACVMAIRAADGGKGVLRLYGNYGGDRMNFDLAGEMLADEGIETTTVLGTDDVASASPADAASGADASVASASSIALSGAEPSAAVGSAGARRPSWSASATGLWVTVYCTAWWPDGW